MDFVQLLDFHYTNLCSGNSGTFSTKVSIRGKTTNKTAVFEGLLSMQRLRFREWENVRILNVQFDFSHGAMLSGLFSSPVGKNRNRNTSKATNTFGTYIRFIQRLTETELKLLYKPSLCPLPVKNTCTDCSVWRCHSCSSGWPCQIQHWRRE